MIFYELINQRSLLEMMPKAFFNMSRSVSASFRRFSSSETLPASPSRERTLLPGKLLSPRSWYSLHQRYNSAGEIPNSCASSEAFFLSRLSLTAFSFECLVVMCSLFSHTLTNVSFLCLIFCPSKVSNSTIQNSAAYFHILFFDVSDLK